MNPLTKTDFIRGLNCPGEMWLRHHDRSRLPDFDEFAKHRMSQGNLAGELAKKLYPQGHDIKELNMQKAAEITKGLLPKREVIFEAAFFADGLFSRPDILIPVGEEEWDFIEVKATNEVKKEKFHPEDVAFQKIVYEKFGLKIRRCYLMHFDKEYVKDGEVDVKRLFIKEDLTETVQEIIPALPEKIRFMREILASPTFPNTIEKNYCHGPKKCDVEDCWNFLPEIHVFHLIRGGKKSKRLFEEGVVHLHDVPDDYKLTARQDIQVRCRKTGKEHIEVQNVKNFLSTLKEPLCYLDFETIQWGVPVFDNTRPWQQILFQWSLHVNEDHFEFLHDRDDDPRSAFLAKLKENLPESGSVIVFNETFEIKRLEELGRDFPEYKEWINSVLSRIVDLAQPFSKFWYYNPKQNGSYSLKKVLPALTEKDYSELDIQDGGCAAIKYLEMISGGISAAEKKKIYSDLLKYCGLDTEAMVWILREMRAKV